MIKLYFHPSPNPMKVVLFLEETGLPYEIVPVDTRKGEQHLPDYLKINPNAKTPTMTDGDVVIFDSSAIMLYLAEKSGGQFMTANDPVTRGQMLSWLMFIATGIGPYSGQAVHFQHFAPEPKEYAVNRYVFEAERHYGILDARLATQEWLVGDHYSFIDMSLWGWERAMPRVVADVWTKFPNIKRHFDAINARPAAERAAAFATKFTFKQEMDADARRAMFPGNARIGVL